MIQAFSRAIQTDPTKVPRNLPQMIENVNDHVATLTEKVAMLTKNTDKFKSNMDAIYEQLKQHRQTLDTLNDRLVADENRIRSTNKIDNYQANSNNNNRNTLRRLPTNGNPPATTREYADSTAREATPAQNNPQNNETGEFSTVENFFGGLGNLFRGTNYYLKAHKSYILLDKKYKVGNTSMRWYYSLSKDNVIRYYVNEDNVYNTDNSTNDDMTILYRFLSELYNNKKAWFSTLPNNIRDFKVTANNKIYRPVIKENGIPEFTITEKTVFVTNYAEPDLTYYMLVKDDDNTEFKLDEFGNITNRFSNTEEITPPADPPDDPSLTPATAAAQKASEEAQKQAQIVENNTNNMTDLLETIQNSTTAINADNTTQQIDTITAAMNTAYNAVQAATTKAQNAASIANNDAANAANQAAENALAEAEIYVVATAETVENIWKAVAEKNKESDTPIIPPATGDNDDTEVVLPVTGDGNDADGEPPVPEAPPTPDGTNIPWTDADKITILKKPRSEIYKKIKEKIGRTTGIAWNTKVTKEMFDAIVPTKKTLLVKSDNNPDSTIDALENTEWKTDGKWNDFNGWMQNRNNKNWNMQNLLNNLGVKK